MMVINILEHQRLIQCMTVLGLINVKDSKEQDYKQVNISGNHGAFSQMNLMNNKIIQLS